MLYETDQMNAILMSETGRRMLEYITRVYDDSYTALWIFQAMGETVGEIVAFAEGLKLQTNPLTATWALDYYEDEYNLPRDSSLTLEERRARIVTKKQKQAPYNPYKIALAVATALDILTEKVYLIENVKKNVFYLVIEEYISDLSKVHEIIGKMKQSHLIYEVKVAVYTIAESTVKVAVAMNAFEKNTVEVQKYG